MLYFVVISIGLILAIELITALILGAIIDSNFKEEP